MLLVIRPVASDFLHHKEVKMEFIIKLDLFLMILLIASEGT